MEGGLINGTLQYMDGKPEGSPIQNPIPNISANLQQPLSMFVQKLQNIQTLNTNQTK